MLFQLQRGSSQRNENIVQSERINALTTTPTDRIFHNDAQTQQEGQIKNSHADHIWPNAAHVTHRAAPARSEALRGDSRTIAVLIDFENIAQHNKNLIRDVLKEIAAAGRIVLRRAYGDWGRFSQRKHDLCKQGIELVEMPAGCARKNSADMQLAADGMELAVCCPNIDTIVVISGDRDFIPMASKLRLWGRDVWFAAPKSHASSFLAAHCDRFIDLEQFKRSTPNPTSQNKPAPSTTPVKASSPTAKPSPATALAPSKKGVASVKGMASRKMVECGGAMGVPNELLGTAAWAINICRNAYLAQTMPSVSSAYEINSSDLTEEQHQQIQIPMAMFFSTLHQLAPKFELSTIVGQGKKPRVKLTRALQTEGVLETWFCEDTKRHYVRPAESTAYYRSATTKPANFEALLEQLKNKFALAL